MVPLKKTLKALKRICFVTCCIRKCRYIGVVKSMPKPIHKTNLFRPGDCFRVGRTGHGFDLWKPRPKFTIGVFTIWSLKPFDKNRQAFK